VSITGMIATRPSHGCMHRPVRCDYAVCKQGMQGLLYRVTTVQHSPWLHLAGIPKDDQRLLRELDDARALAACELGGANRATIYLTVRTPRRCGHAYRAQHSMNICLAVGSHKPHIAMSVHSNACGGRAATH